MQISSLIFDFFLYPGKQGYRGNWEKISDDFYNCQSTLTCTVKDLCSKVTWSRGRHNTLGRDTTYFSVDPAVDPCKL